MRLPPRPGPGRRIALATILALTPAATLAQPLSARPLSLRDALRARRPLLIVVAPPDRALPDAEAVGDWAHYLNDAVLALPSDVTVARVTRAGFHSLLAAPVLRGDYATLFARPDRSALLHAGLVLDPPTYVTGFAFLEAGTAPPDSAGLLLTHLRPR